MTSNMWESCTHASLCEVLASSFSSRSYIHFVHPPVQALDTIVDQTKDMII
jgi:hypothetical protein